MKYMKKKKLIAVMALLIIAVSFGGCNSSNTAAAINSEVTSSEIVSSVPVSSEVTSSKEASSEAVSSAPVSSEEEKPESEAVSSEAAASSMPEVSSKTEAPTVTSEPTVSSAPAAVSKPAETSQPVSSTASSAPVESVAQTSSAPPAQTASAPTHQSGSTKAVEDMTEEELDQWMLDQLERLNNQPIEVHEYGTDGGTGGNSAKSTQPTEGAGDVYEAIRLINEERVKAGLNELEIDDALMEITSIRATELIQSPSHTRPDGTKYWHMFSEYDINSRGIGGECIAPSATAQKAVTEWMHSPGHRDIILTEGANRIGVGYIYDANSSLEHNWILIVCD